MSGTAEKSDRVKASEQVVARMVVEDFRIEREDCHLINFTTGDSRYSPAARVYLRKENGRWAKTDLLLMAHDETPTIGDVLRSFAALLDQADPAVGDITMTHRVVGSTG